MPKNVTPTTDLVEILTQFETAINANMAQIATLTQLVDTLTNRVITLETATPAVATPAVATPSVGTYRPTFGAVPVSAPKQTSPSKPSGKKAGSKATPAVTSGTIDYATVAGQVVANTKAKVWNENLAESKYLIANDPRLFLTPTQSGAFRRQYKTAGIHYTEAARILADVAGSLGWVYPS